MQILEAVALGASLEAVKASTVKQDIAGLHKEVFRGKGETQLSVWRTIADKTIHSFEFRMNAYGVRWTEGMTELETYAIVEKNFRGSAPRAARGAWTDQDPARRGELALLSRRAELTEIGPGRCPGISRTARRLTKKGASKEAPFL